jgi:hypothetical protein
LLETNYLLGKNGAIPLLSLALSETLAAVTHQLEAARTSLLSDSNSYVQKCGGCVAALQFRVQKLVSLIDGASLLSPSNGEHFCREGFTGEAGGFLVVGLLNADKFKPCEQNSCSGTRSVVVPGSLWQRDEVIRGEGFFWTSGDSRRFVPCCIVV